jgi:hypothetical protein
MCKLCELLDQNSKFSCSQSGTLFNNISISSNQFNSFPFFYHGLLLASKQLIQTYLTYSVQKYSMNSEKRYDYWKQKTNALFGLSDMMLCEKCHLLLANSFKFATRN